MFRPATELIVENESIQPIEINGGELRSDTSHPSEQITIAESKDDIARYRRNLFDKLSQARKLKLQMKWPHNDFDTSATAQDFA